MRFSNRPHGARGRVGFLPTAPREQESRKPESRTPLARVAGIVTLLLLIHSAPGLAEEPGAINASGGYSFLSGAGQTDGFGLGWFAEGGWQATTWVTVVGEVSRHRRTQDVGFLDVEATHQAALAGARFHLRRSGVLPFVHLLAGVTRLDLVARTSVPVEAAGQDAATYRTLQFGAGIDTRLTDRFGLRLRADYRRVFTDGGTNHIHVGTGLLYRF